MISLNQIIDNLNIIEFDTTIVVDIKLVFRLYYYATMFFEFVRYSIIYFICVDSKCTMSLIDYQFLKKLDLERLLKKVNALILIRKVNIEKHFTNNYLIINIYIKSYVNRKSAITYICQEIYAVNYLRAKMLLKINVIISKQMIVNLNNKKLTINNCRELTINLEITTRNNIWVRRVLKASKKIIIDVKTITRVFVYSSQSLLNKDYLFELKPVDIYTYIVDSSVFSIYIYNANSISITIDKYINFNCLTRYKKQDYYQISIEKHL